MGDELKLTLLEKTRVQAEVLVPLIRAMEEEMGRESAHRLVRRTLGDQVRQSVRSVTPMSGSRDRVEWLLRASQAGDAIELDRLDGEAGEINVDVTRCQYAEFFEQLNEPELGFLLVVRSTTTSQTAQV